MAYEAIIGMEVHVQVLSASKMFCGCSADCSTASPNTHTCPVCLGMPGVLPVINQVAVEATVRTGLALGCEIPAFSKFDRKNYPYPDLPKGYQISQYDYPFCVNGHLDIISDGQAKTIGIRRVHLEEDTARLIHEADGSLIDFNRAGLPLMEIVTEADLRTAEDAWQYLTKLRAILRYLGVSTGNMEEGAMRCEANVSLRPVGTEPFGTKVEIKNLNSFRSVRQAIAYEIERQSRLLDDGDLVHQITVGWDENARRTFFQRSKEGSADYRYFPEPDLPPLELAPGYVAELRAGLPELPNARRERLVSQHGIKASDAALLVEDREIGDYFESALAAAADDVDPQTVANWTVGELFRLLSESGSEISQTKVSPEALAELLGMIGKDTINQTVAKEVLTEMFTSGDRAQDIIERLGLTQISDSGALAEAVRGALDSNPGPVQQYLGGETKVMGFLIGQIMRATRGQANVQMVREMLTQELEARRT